MVIGSLVSSAAERLSGVCENPLREARILLAYTLSLNVTDIIIKQETEVSVDAEKIFWDNVSKRASHMPMAYITGNQEFYGLKLKVCEGVLIPRPDTEVLTGFAIDFAPENMLDICTGSGCIPIAVKKHCPDASVTAIDIGDTALFLATENSNMHNTDITFKKLDIMKEIPSGRYDLIVSNPPYITASDMQQLMPDVKNFEPHIALCGGEDGLIFYRRICDIAPQILKKGGVLAFEIGYNQYDDVKKIMEHNFSNISFVCDLSGIKRVIYGNI